MTTFNTHKKTLKEKDMQGKYCILAGFRCLQDKKLNKTNTELKKHFVASICNITVPNIEDMEFDVQDVLRSLKVLQSGKTVLIIVTNKIEQNNHIALKIGQDEKYVDFIVYMITYHDLFSNDFILSKIKNNTELSHNFFFLFDKINWPALVLMFKYNNIIVSGGSNTKRYILSPLQLRFSNLIIAIFWKKKDKITTNSYHFFKKDEQRPIDILEEEIDNIYNNWKKINLINNDKEQHIEKEKENPLEINITEKSHKIMEQYMSFPFISEPFKPILYFDIDSLNSDKQINNELIRKRIVKSWTK